MTAPKGAAHLQGETRPPFSVSMKPAAPAPKPVVAVRPIAHAMPDSVIDSLRRWRLEATQRYVARSLKMARTKGANTNVRTVPQHNEKARAR